MNRLLCLLALSVLCIWSPLAGQEFSGGFRAGLNFTTISGPSEMGAGGGELEEYRISNGFHIGAIANVRFTDVFRLRGELLFSQKGGVYGYTGDSYWVFRPLDGSEPFVATGNRETTLEVTNSYIDIPVTGVARLGKFELSAGMSVGFLVGSKAAGEVRFAGQTPLGNAVDPFVVVLDYDYLANPFNEADAVQAGVRRLDSKDVAIPETLGAYYEGVDTDENLFNTIDIGLVGGVAYYLNQGLFMGLRLNYGLSDVTNEARDISRQEINGAQGYTFRDDKDQNLNLQLSVGFSF